MAGSSERELEFDFYDHMDGIWKRNLEWRHFGQAYQHLRTSNTIVQINKHTSRKNGRQFLTWSFGLDLSQTSMKFGYVMKLDPLPENRGYSMQWEYAGSQCTGTYQASTKVAVLHLNMPDSSVTITYRVLDANTMAVCIVEVDTTHTPTIQYGHMNRIDRKYLDAAQEAARAEKE